MLFQPAIIALLADDGALIGTLRPKITSGWKNAAIARYEPAMTPIVASRPKMRVAMRWPVVQVTATPKK